MQEEREASSQKGQSEKSTILVVEDDEHIGAFLVEAITQETPYHALVVVNGTEALSVVQNIVPQLLILDFHLPGMDGLELSDRIRALPNLGAIPIIMMSARLPKRELEKRAIIGIHKPFELDDFLQAIRQLLG